MRSLGLLEIVTIISLSGSLLAVGVPTFVKNVRASRLAEPLDGLKHIGERATFLAQERGIENAYPVSVPQTPSKVPAGESVVDPIEAWDHPTWQALGFRMEHAHYFAFAFDSENGRKRSIFTATAHGDLDGDGLLSTFRLQGEWEPPAAPVLFPIEIQREVE